MDTVTQTLREARFNLDGLNHRVVDHYNMGDYCVFYTLPNQETNNGEQGILFFVHNQTEKIELRQEWMYKVEE